MFAAIVNGIIKGRIAIIIVVLALTVVLGYHIQFIKFDSSSDGSIPKGDPSAEYFEQVKSDFGNDQVAMLVVISDAELGIFEPSTLAKIKRLTDSIGDFAGVDNVVSLTNSRFLTGAGGERLANDPIIPVLPETVDSAIAVRARVLKNKLFHKTLVSPDGKAAAINIFLSNLPDSTLQSTGVDRRINEIVESESGPEKLLYAGLIHTRMEINKTMHRDLKTFIPISFLLIVVILILSFRNLAGVLLPAITIMISVTWTFGLIGFFGVPINMTMTIIPPLLIAITCAYAIYVVSGFYDRSRTEMDSKKVVRDTLLFMAAPFVSCVITDQIGFSSNIVSSIPNNQKAAVWCTIGVALSMALCLSFVPAMLTFVKAKHKKAASDPDESEHGHGSDFMSRLVERIIHFDTKHPVIIFSVAGLVLLLSLIGMFRIQVNTDFLSYFKKDSEIRKTADIIGQKLAGVSTFYVIAESDSADILRDAEVLQRIDSIQKYMESLPGIDKTSSMVNILKVFHQAMNSDNPDSHIVTSSQEALDEAILLTIDQEDPAVRAHYVVEDYSSMAIFVRSQLVSTSELAKTIEKIEQYASGVLPKEIAAKATGTVVVFAKSISSIISSQVNSLILSVSLVFLIMAYLFRSVKVGLITLLPNVLPILTIFGLMGFVGITLNMGTSMVASIALGIAVDDTIHLFATFRDLLARGMDRQEAAVEAARHCGKPVIYTSVAMSLGFLVLCLSDFGMLSSVGFLAGVTMLVCVASDLFMSVAIITRFDLSKNPRRKPAARNLPTEASQSGAA